MNSIVITGGDPAGISPEIIENLGKQMVTSSLPILYFSTADASHNEYLLDLFHGNGIESSQISINRILDGKSEVPKFPIEQSQSLHIITMHEDPLIPDDLKKDKIIVGKPTRLSGALAFLAFRRAVEYIKENGCGGLLTAPLSKEWVIRSAVEGARDFSGHTRYLSRAFNRNVLMVMHGENFSVIPITEHVPLMSVAYRLKMRLEDPRFLELLRSINNIPEFQGARWALCALNPHAGEGGLIGSEESDYINDAVKWMQKVELPVEGPFPADGLFLPGVRKNYKLILCPYHDQALIPFKALEGSTGINWTMGLPFIRCSPDHGCAYGIARKGQAESESMIRAYRAVHDGALTRDGIEKA